jgi:hypothetical protein
MLFREKHSITITIIIITATMRITGSTCLAQRDAQRDEEQGWREDWTGWIEEVVGGRGRGRARPVAALTRELRYSIQAWRNFIEWSVAGSSLTFVKLAEFPISD